MTIYEKIMEKINNKRSPNVPTPYTTKTPSTNFLGFIVACLMSACLAFLKKYGEIL